MKFFKVLTSMFLGIFFTEIVFAKADWTILNYIQADNNLYSYALQDLSEMMAIGSNNNINILVQIDIPNNNGTWRYKVDKGKLTLESYIQSEMGIQVVKELVDSAAWAFDKNKYSANHYMLILSGHGSGVLDPKKRGILFDDNPSNSYVNNQQLYSALSQIKTMLNKNIDILGNDACLMAMLEVGYQVKNFVDVFVASEESESSLGWYYTGFLSKITSGLSSSKILSSYIVSSYQDFYKNKNNYYTLSSIDLSKIDLIRQNLNQIVDAINDCKKLNSQKVKTAVKTARNKSLEFAVSDFIDLYSFYSQLSTSLNATKSIEEDDYELKSSLRPKPGQRPSHVVIRPPIKPTNSSIRPTNTVRPTNHVVQPISEYAKKVDIAKSYLSRGMSLISSTVLANVAGSINKNAKGISIYYPKYGIYSSYASTNFAKESLWVNFLVDYA